MPFNNLFQKTRQVGRKIVLPVDNIKTIITSILVDIDVKAIIDFGAGTLFWSKWFYQKYRCRVLAVDLFYDELIINDGVKCYKTLSDCFMNTQEITLAFTSDVLHHLSPSAVSGFLEEISERINIIIIKDIDANYKFGNLLNKIHDRIINQEKIWDIYPEKLSDQLKIKGFKTKYYFIPKLWYPHFILIGKK